MYPLNHTPELLVGICGKAREGKGTAARLLTNWGFREYAYATPVKRMIDALLGDDAPGDDAKTEDIEWLGVDRRTLYQTLGTGWGRDMIHEDLWIAYLARRLERDRPRAVVVSDVRFPNEAEFIRSNGGLLLRIAMPEEESRAEREARIGADLEVGGIPGHESESFVDGISCHATLKNSGTVEALQAALFEHLLAYQDARRGGPDAGLFAGDPAFAAQGA